MKRTAAIVLSVLLPVFAMGQDVIMKTATVVLGGHRIDAQTTGELTTLPANLTSSLVFYQEFSNNDNTNKMYYDLSTQGNNGSQSNLSYRPTQVSSNGGSIAFDIIDNRIELGHPQDLYPRTSDFSLFVFFKGHDTAADQTIVSIGNPAPLYGGIWITITLKKEDYILFRCDDNAAPKASASTHDVMGDWQMAGLVIDSSNFLAYTNYGGLRQSQAQSFADLNPGTSPCLLGAVTYDDTGRSALFGGMLGAVYVWKGRALSATEAEQLWDHNATRYGY